MWGNWSKFRAYGQHKAFSSISRRHTTGVWCVRDPEFNQRQLYFDAGRLVFAVSPLEAEQFERAMIDLELVSLQQLDRVKAEFDLQKTMARNLIDMGLMSVNELLSAARRQLEMVLNGALAMESGQILFLEELPSQLPQVTPLFPHTVVKAILALDDREHLAHHLGNDFDKIPVFCETVSNQFCQEIGIPVDLVSLADGERTVKQIAFESFLDFFLVLKLFYAFELLGFCVFKSKQPLT